MRDEHGNTYVTLVEPGPWYENSRKYISPSEMSPELEKALTEMYRERGEH